MVIDPDLEKYVPPPPDIEQKFCKKCMQWKSTDDFFKRGGKSRYLAGYCKNCHSQPFKYEAICCPHCKEKITFFGISKGGEIVKQKSEILAKLKKEAKASSLKRVEKAEKEKVATTKKDLKGIFG